CSLDFRSCVQRSGSKPARFGACWKALRPSRAANNSLSDFGVRVLCSIDFDSSAQGTVSRPVKLFAGSFWETCMLPLPKYLSPFLHILEIAVTKRGRFSISGLHSSSKKIGDGVMMPFAVSSD